MMDQGVSLGQLYDVQNWIKISNFLWPNSFIMTQDQENLTEVEYTVQLTSLYVLVEIGPFLYLQYYLPLLQNKLP